MAVCRIVMCPMDEAALRIPDIFAGKADHIIRLEIIDTRSKAGIMLDQDRLSRRKPQDKLLMRKSRSVVRQNL